MRRTLFAAGIIAVAAVVDAVPSKAALNPMTARCGFKEDDLSGAGLEVRRARTLHAHSRDKADARLIDEWRAMAARCRDLARWQNADAREVLLKLAEEYEARANRANSLRKS
jgi:hypothetical protein